MDILVNRSCHRLTYSEISQGLSDALIPELANLVLEFCDKWIVEPTTSPVQLLTWFDSPDLCFFD